MRAPIDTNVWDVTWWIDIRGGASFDEYYSYGSSYSNGTTWPNASLGGAPATVTPFGFIFSIDRANIRNATEGWMLFAGTEMDEDHDSLTDWFDRADFFTFDEYDAAGNHDISAEPSPFGTPGVTIDVVRVVQNGSGFELTVEGRTSGDVLQMRAVMGTRFTIGGDAQVWEFGNYEIGGGAWSPRHRGSLEETRPPWKAWKFSWTYNESVLLGGWGSSFRVSGAKVEVRAYTADGSWGHANTSFPPLETYDSRDMVGAASRWTQGGESIWLVMLVLLVLVAMVLVWPLFPRRGARSGARKRDSPPAALDEPVEQHGRQRHRGSDQHDPLERERGEQVVAQGEERDGQEGRDRE